MDAIKRCTVAVTEAFRASQIVREYIKPTQLTHHLKMSKDFGMETFIKHENHNPTGSFKIRGGVNLMHHLKNAGVKGVITFSTGNHGLSVAAAAQWFGLKATIVVPENNTPAKNQLIRSYGANLVEYGATFEESSQMVEKLCQEEALYYIHPANEPHLINGVGTEFLEILEDLPDLDVMIVPIGAGSEAAAAVTVLKALKPEVKIIAVQAESSPAAYHSWKNGEICAMENRTFAGGFATGKGYDLTFNIYKDALDDFILLSEKEIYEGIALAMHYTHNMVEGAGASCIMAALKLRDSLREKKVVLQMSGCNASPQEIREALQCDSFFHGLT